MTPTAKNLQHWGGALSLNITHNPGDALSPKDFTVHIFIPNSSLSQVLGTIIV